MGVQKCQLIEIVSTGVATTGNPATKIQFTDQPYLRNRKIYGIEILTASDVNTSPSNKAVITGAQMKSSYLTLYLNDVGMSRGTPMSGDQSMGTNVGEWMQLIPFCLMHRVQNNVIPSTALPSPPGVQFFEPYVRNLFEMAGQVIYWEKCYVTLSVPFANTTDVSFLFNVYFK